MAHRLTKTVVDSFAFLEGERSLYRDARLQGSGLYVEGVLKTSTQCHLNPMALDEIHPDGFLVVMLT